MVRRTSLRSLALLPLLWSGCASAESPTSRPAFAAPVSRAAEPPELTRARAVMRDVQRTFWRGDVGGYVELAGGDRAAFMWSSGIAFSAVVAADRYDPAVYRPVLRDLFIGLDRYWDGKQPLGGYEPGPSDGDEHDKYYDDNAWMAITFVEAYQQTGNRHYLDRAKQVNDFVLSGWDDQLGGGIWWHEQHKDGTKNTCVNAPAAVACLSLARFLPPDQAVNLRERATAIVGWTQKHLQDGNALYADRENVATGEVFHGKLTYNTALMIRAELGLYRATGDANRLAEAKRVADAADAFLDPQTHVYHDSLKWSHLQVEADLEIYRATGDDRYLQRARRCGMSDYMDWIHNPSAQLIENAALARELYLLADAVTPVGQAFWKVADATP